MRLLLDENLSCGHALRLRESGHDAVAVTEEGLNGASDPLVRSAAIQSNRALVTLDADFGNIIRYPPTKSKIEQALDRCLSKLGAEDLRGKLVVVDEDKIRVRG